MRLYSLLQVAGTVALSVSWAVVFGWWAVVSLAGMVALAVGVALERRAVDG